MGCPGKKNPALFIRKARNYFVAKCLLFHCNFLPC